MSFALFQTLLFRTHSSSLYETKNLEIKRNSEYASYISISKFKIEEIQMGRVCSNWDSISCVLLLHHPLIDVLFEIPEDT